MSKKIKENKENRAMTRQEILDHCRARSTELVPVESFPFPVTMKNLTFSEVAEIRTNSAGVDDYQALLIAAACEDLSIADAQELKNGQASRFTELLIAVNKFLGFTATDPEVQK